MKDSRITLLTSDVINLSGADAVDVGPTIDLWDGSVPAGGAYVGTNPYCGVGAELLVQEDSFAGTGTLTLEIRWQVASDDGAGSPDTWLDHSVIKYFEGTAANLNADTPLRFFSTLRTPRRFARLAFDFTSGASDFAADINAWAEDFRDLFSEGAGPVGTNLA